MSGHNKWSQIKRQKGTEDAKKSKLFGVLAKTITLEAKKSGGDKNNPSLRQAIERARAANLPLENIERAIGKATGSGGADFVEVLYEAYGPGGVAIIIEGITDNKNRLLQELKQLLTNHRASLAAPGAVLWAFQKATDGSWQAISPIIPNEEDRGHLESLVKELEEHPDVKKVYAAIGN